MSEPERVVRRRRGSAPGSCAGGARKALAPAERRGARGTAAKCEGNEERYARVETGARSGRPESVLAVPSLLSGLMPGGGACTRLSSRKVSGLWYSALMQAIAEGCTYKNGAVLLNRPINARKAPKGG